MAPFAERPPASEQEVIEVMVIDDNPGDRELIEAYLEAAGGRFRSQGASSLTEAISLLASYLPDVIVLDLTLPESQGIDTLRRLLGEAPNTPIVVLSGMEDEKITMLSLQHGAQDYLLKGRIDPEILHRCLRYAIERFRLIQQLEIARASRDNVRETMTIAGLSANAGVTARLYGARSLREHSPEVFGELVDKYRSLVGIALERQVTRIDDSIPGELRSMASRLGKLVATPKDVVELHRVALQDIHRRETPVRGRAMREEGRFLVLELMGHLVTYYRRTCGRCPYLQVNEKGSRGASSVDGQGGAS